MPIQYKCKLCGFLLKDPDHDCPHCAEDNIFSGGQTMERQIIRERISKVVPRGKNKNRTTK